MPLRPQTEVKSFSVVLEAIEAPSMDRFGAYGFGERQRHVWHDSAHRGRTAAQAALLDLAWIGALRVTQDYL